MKQSVKIRMLNMATEVRTEGDEQSLMILRKGLFEVI